MPYVSYGFFVRKQLKQTKSINHILIFVDNIVTK